MDTHGFRPPAPVKKQKTQAERHVFGAPADGTVRALKVRVASLMQGGQVVCTLECNGAATQVRFTQGLADALVLEVGCADGTAVRRDDPLFVYACCEHAFVIRGLCTTCHADLSKRAIGSAPAARVQLLPSQPDFFFDQSVATRVAELSTARLRQTRKLSLVLDLDLTLLHATSDARHARVLSDAPADDARDIVQFTLGNGSSQHWVKLRPGLREFLAQAHERYELHVFTHGSKEYGVKIAEILDPDNVLFAPQEGVGERRVTTIDDAYSEAERQQKDARHHYKRLDRLFPVSDAHVLALDDSYVWGDSPNVIRAVPFVFWRTLQREAVGVFEANADDNDEADGTRTPVSSLYRVDAVRDDHLANVLRVLNGVHDAFYGSTAGTADAPHVGVLFARVRRQVLQGCVLAFSGVFPQGGEPSTHPLWRLALDYGAQCIDEVRVGVTHLVCSHGGTRKAQLARVMGHVRVVHINWLLDSLRQFARMDESRYADVPGERQIDRVLMALMEQLARAYLALPSVAVAEPETADGLTDLDVAEMARLLADDDDDGDGDGDSLRDFDE